MYVRQPYLDFIMTRKKKGAKNIPGVDALISLLKPLTSVKSVSVKSDLPIIQTS